MAGFGGFGISLSDIVLVANFTSRVRSAFDEDKGVKSRYQSLVQSLDSLQAILEKLRNLTLSDPNFAVGGKLAGQVQGSLSLISSFQDGVEKYESA
jgi:hypothetical protein